MPEDAPVPTPVVQPGHATPHVVRLSPRHAVTVDDDYFAMIQRAPQEDFVVRTLARTMAGDAPLMTGELVIAGFATRQRFPLAGQYPLHFRKTYFPGRLRGDTEVELQRNLRASEVLGIPPPIGRAGGTFRTCLLPGRPLDQVIPFGSEPPESNIKHAEGLTIPAAAGLWMLADRATRVLTTLHGAGMTHGDAVLHNFVVCDAPLDVVPIDFDMSIERGAVSTPDWESACARDLEPLLKVAVFLQCALGAQEDLLGDLSRARMHDLFERSAPFERAIEERAALFARPLPSP
jgi:hypothetical protein